VCRTCGHVKGPHIAQYHSRKRRRVEGGGADEEGLCTYLREHPLKEGEVVPPPNRKQSWKGKCRHPNCVEGCPDHIPKQGNNEEEDEGDGEEGGGGGNVEGEGV
jgi:hypothetical protein